MSDHTRRLKPRRWQIAAALLAGAVLSAIAVRTSGKSPTQPHVSATSPETAGEYLAVIGGCHDCHTPGWMESGGNVPPEQWLIGRSLGFRGPWGTSYPANLRLTAATLTDQAWLAMIRTRDALPPMPWMNLHRMAEDDLIAIRRHLVALGPAGEPAPGAVPPGQEPQTPYFLFVPQEPKR